MSRVGFEPTIPVFERTKIVHALDYWITVIGALNVLCGENTKVLLLNPVVHIVVTVLRRLNKYEAVLGLFYCTTTGVNRHHFLNVERSCNI
jgi:hypothetical protein